MQAGRQAKEENEIGQALRYYMIKKKALNKKGKPQADRTQPGVS
jgi:hypothetical protein